MMLLRHQDLREELSMTDQEQIHVLKAQVNCLREALLEQRSRYHVAKDLDAVLEATPEQCLAEVKANMIEDAAILINRSYYPSQTLIDYAKELREQAK